MASLTKRNKIFFYDKKGNVRRLDKTSLGIYLFILTEFTQRGAGEKYQNINKEILSKPLKLQFDHKFIPVSVKVPTELYTDFETVLQVAFKKESKGNNLSFTYNGYTKALVQLHQGNPPVELDPK